MMSSHLLHGKLLQHECDESHQGQLLHQLIALRLKTEVRNVSTGAGLGESHLSSIRRPADVDINSTAPLMEVLCNTSLGTDTNHLLSLANTYTSITGVSKLLVNDIWVVDSDARVELCQYRL